MSYIIRYISWKWYCVFNTGGCRGRLRSFLTVRGDDEVLGLLLTRRFQNQNVSTFQHSSSINLHRSTVCKVFRSAFQLFSLWNRIASSFHAHTEQKRVSPVLLRDTKIAKHLGWITDLGTGQFIFFWLFLPGGVLNWTMLKYTKVPRKCR